MPAEIQELMQQAEQLIAYITQNAASINAETQRALAQFLQETNDFIQEFSGELPSTGEMEAQQAEVANEVTPQAPAVPPGGPVPELDDAPFPSSNISRFRYDPESQKLIIQFLGNHPNRNGSVYEYSQVPQNIFNIFRRGAVAPRTSGSNAWHTWKEGSAPSLGASAYALIREGGFSYRRLS